MHPADTAPRLPSPYRLRFDAALRTLRLALRRHIRRQWTRPLVFKYGKGAVDRIDIREGRMHLSGWTDAHLITVASEIQSRQVVPMLPRPDIADRPAARGFDLCLTGTERLTIEADGALLMSLDPSPALHRGLAAARLLVRLLRVPVFHGRDLAAFALQGDSTAGTRLERMLLPPPPAPRVPSARPGLFRAAEPAPLDSSVDIIVPVHNAPDELRSCLDRLVRFTPRLHRITVIDDASTNPRVADILTGLEARHPGLRLLWNDTNLGFIGTVNRGLAAARGHVVLVNTDAFAPENWLERLLHPILTDPAVASVTPMTNSGETASVPQMCRATPLPEGLADRIDRAAATLDPTHANTEMPTGVGFCMALSRDWLARLPAFDTAFGRGYGEEVDWCRKTAALGARHVLTGALFVEHRGGSSFGPEKAARLAANNRLISRRYPGYDAAVQAFIDEDPAIGPRLALALAMVGAARRVRVYLGHRLGGGLGTWPGRQAHGAVPRFLPALSVLQPAGRDRQLLRSARRRGLPGLLFPSRPPDRGAAGDHRHLARKVARPPRPGRRRDGLFRFIP
ncbi:glycosyltransferase family 2 protein [Rhodovulum steppense]|uniref:GT2 family glycosyltransferase n=1 Tax=Rhodovulum steppense TaxID=540251 RepID=A0A4R1YHX7_9RHOB|nr:glycosyltransferase family 2 protein [Rhodovulum steppense]TCM75894.1 GT2 family glycosyltransferase [Rhodovulum steppense]